MQPSQHRIVAEVMSFLRGAIRETRMGVILVDRHAGKRGSTFTPVVRVTRTCQISRPLDVAPLAVRRSLPCRLLPFPFHLIWTHRLKPVVPVTMSLLDRFLRYVRIDTKSDEASSTSPSTLKQLDLSRLLAEECRSLGLADVSIDEQGIVMATIPATVPHRAR